MRGIPEGVTPEEARAAEVFRALSNPIRLHIFRLIAERDRYCGRLVDQVGLSQSTVSHHLRILSDAGLIEGIEEGPATCYRINRAVCHSVCSMLPSILGTG